MKTLPPAPLLLAALCLALTAAQSPCTLASECANGCCELLEVNGVLGYYCQNLGECNKAALGVSSFSKAQGASCDATNDCESNCCEGGVCRSARYCYASYLQPFLVVLVLVLLIILAVVLFFVIRSAIRKRKHKRRAIDQEAAPALP